MAQGQQAAAGINGAAAADIEFTGAHGGDGIAFAAQAHRFVTPQLFGREGVVQLHQIQILGPNAGQPISLLRDTVDRFVIQQVGGR